jgi:hypothetical protein
MYIHIHTCTGLKSARSVTQEYELVQSCTDSLKTETETSFEDENDETTVYL